MKKFLLALELLLILIIPARSEAQLPIITEAITHLGKPYVYATSGPNTFDCSGFTCYLIKQAYDIVIPHNAYKQGYDNTYAKIESVDELEPGDLVYFNTNTYDNDKCDHTGLYIGDGRFIHASSKYKEVIISNLDEGFYNERFSWGRRIAP